MVDNYDFRPRKECTQDSAMTAGGLLQLHQSVKLKFQLVGRGRNGKPEKLKLSVEKFYVVTNDAMSDEILLGRDYLEENEDDTKKCLFWIEKNKPKKQNAGKLFIPTWTCVRSN